jgi:hypothetical protein
MAEMRNPHQHRATMLPLSGRANCSEPAPSGRDPVAGLIAFAAPAIAVWSVPGEKAIGDLHGTQKARLAQ